MSKRPLGDTLKLELASRGKRLVSITIESIFRDQNRFCEELAERGWDSMQAARLAAMAGGGLAIYGLTMGAQYSIPQALSSAVKLPLLYLVTLLITLPAFHFVSLYLGSRNSLGKTILSLGYGTAVTAVLAASIAPISLFFMLIGSSYHFLVLLHVAVLGFCSCAGAATMFHNMTYLNRKGEGFSTSTTAEWCFSAWLLLFAIVGTQMGYMLRPFIGSAQEFELLRTEPGNFFEAVFRAVGAFFSA